MTRRDGWGRIALAGFAALLAVGRPGAALGGAPRTSGTPLSLDPLLDPFVRRAVFYEKAALGFSCDETILVGKFSGPTPENRKEDKTRYNYLYEKKSGSGYEEVRYILDRNDVPQESRIVDPDLPIPGAYDWALLFTDQHRPRFRFDAAGEEMVGFHPARILAFTGSKVWDNGREIEEWSGKVWLDRETGNFLKITAAPNNQDQLLPLRMTKWMKGVRLGGLPLKKEPRGYDYQLSFTVEKFGLTFPGEAVTRLFVLTPQGEEEIRQRITQSFGNYVFFNVHSEEEFLERPAPPTSPPKR